MTNEIIAYLLKYWEKYPDEAATDMSIAEVIDLSKAVEVYISERLLILYKEYDAYVDLEMYWCDGAGHDIKEVKRGFIEHKRFIKSFGKPVYIEDIKDTFKRENMVKYCSELNKWRLL